MRVIRLTYLILLLLHILLPGCTEPIDLRSEDMEPRLVITGVLSTEPGYQIIEISSTIPYFGTGTPVSLDAREVRLNGELLVRDAPGIYSMGEEFAAEEGKTYVLEVWIDYNQDGQEEYYSATTTVPYIHVLETLSLKSLVSGNVPFLLMVGFQDTPGEDYYGAALWINDVLYSNRILRYYIHTLNDYSQDGSFIHYPIPEWIITKALPWDNEETFDLFSGDVLTVEMQTLSKEYYKFLEEAKIEKNQQFPLFSGPRGNVSGNISGGALGIFGSYASSRKSVTLPECPGLPDRQKDG
ncbi:MAG: hypothetical protein BWX62_00652 [Bacteroidetes bacterium ADurb.Bin037]|nr:MAG: hypothetical protein BWX62_00652 [Bacteroidetes bacterium ADurb.Bin037]HPW78127.1 DUF4249 domain-containing protein [Bacteroidales bacterium]HQB56642.1 DUF4249 domain-containing protein [Bacteroidales bacterium]